MSKDQLLPPNSRLLPAREIEVSGEHEGRRLDKYLRAELKGVPATLLFRLLRKGKIRVNARRAQPNYRLQTGDVFQLPPIQMQEAIPPPPLPGSLLHCIDQSVVHEDERLIIINKPADIAVHVGTGVAGGVIEALRQLWPDLPDLELVHRLDRETSGLLMVAKTPSILRHLQEVLRNDGPLERRYLTLVRGAWPADVREVDVPLRRTDTSVTVQPNGQPALTRFSVRRRIGRDATLIQARLITGRKHQIRVHTRHAGHPIVGDPKYGDTALNQQFQRLGAAHMFLHASELHVPLPEGDTLKVSAPIPASWDRALNRLSSHAGSPRSNKPRAAKPRTNHTRPNKPRSNKPRSNKPGATKPRGH